MSFNFHFLVNIFSDKERICFSKNVSYVAEESLLIVFPAYVISYL